MAGAYQVGAYYFPNYHVDPRNEAEHGRGWTEWELVRRATPRFPGHAQPRQPVWGYADEADPQVMDAKLEAAASHGIDYLIFDWYWYDDGPYLQRALEEGYLRATGRDRVRFCCMWANHDWLDIHPARLRVPPRLLYPGRVTPAAFSRLTRHLIDAYFTTPSYFVVDGCPYFSVYDLGELLASFGGVGQTRLALDGFRDRARAAGLAGLHLNAVVWGRPVLPGEQAPAEPGRLVRDLGFDSVTSYVWVHHVPLDGSPVTEYEGALAKYLDYWDEAERTFAVPYYPNGTVGWDASPRTVQSDVWEPAGYPYTNALEAVPPSTFARALERIRDRLDQRAGARILNINSWNEWTEGSYLEPDTRYGTGYLEAVRQVFGGPVSSPAGG